MKKFTFSINGNQYEVKIGDIEENIAEISVNGTSYNVVLDRDVKTSKTPKLVRAKTIPATDSGKPKTTAPTKTLVSSFIKSPLPGTIFDIHIKEGEQVSIGSKLMTLEAMKMENIINSDKEGTVKSIKYSKGDAVLEGDILIEIGN